MVKYLAALYLLCFSSMGFGSFDVATSNLQSPWCINVKLCGISSTVDKSSYGQFSMVLKTSVLAASAGFCTIRVFVHLDRLI